MRGKVSIMIAFVLGIMVGALFFASDMTETVFASDSPTLKIKEFMTVEELRETGVGYLSEGQVKALDKWLTSYTFHVIRSVSSKTYSGTGGGHWISKNIDGGRYILLEDGSLWEIDAYYTIDTGLWLPVSEITVIENGINYLLINTDDGEKAEAKFIGYQ